MNEIDSSFSTLNENKFIDLILYDSNTNLMTKITTTF